jgi:hypothetical protein
VVALTPSTPTEATPRYPWGGWGVETTLITGHSCADLYQLDRLIEVHLPKLFAVRASRMSTYILNWHFQLTFSTDLDLTVVAHPDARDHVGGGTFQRQH